MNKDLIKFLNYLKVEKNYSEYTIKNYEIDINDFILYCDRNKLNIYSITYKEIKSYLSNLFDLKYKSTTISRRISALRTFYTYLYKSKLVDKNVFKYVTLPKKEKKLPKYLSNDDVSNIFNSIKLNSPIGIRNRLVLELLYDTGIRVSELCNIKLNDIELTNKTIRVLGKGRKARIVCFGDICKEVIDMYLEDSRPILLNNKQNDYLIIGAYKKDVGISVRSVQSIVDKVIKDAAIKKKISPHVLRHTFATHMLNEGCDILIVKELLGHSSLDTTGIYTHISNERLRHVYLNNHPRAKKDL